MAVDGRILRQHHPVGIPELQQPEYGGDPPVIRQHVLHAEAVHPDRRAVVHELAKVVKVLGVAGVTDDDPFRGDAVPSEERLLLQAVARLRHGVGRDRDAGL